MATFTTEVNNLELWASFWGSGLESDPVTCSWVKEIDFIEGRWDKVGKVKITYAPDGLDDYNTETKTKVLGLDEVIEAVNIMTKGDFHHCGYKMDFDTDKWDVCVADVILQLAVLGEYTFA